MSVKRVVVALCALIYFGLTAAAGAAPPDVDAKSVGKSREAVRAHWTAARMRAAVPATPDAQDGQLAPGAGELVDPPPPPPDEEVTPAQPTPTSFPFDSGEF